MSDVAIARAADIVPPPAVQTETGALISMIERAARDPAVDVAKMERLFEMSERARATVARMAYDAAYAAMAVELPEIDKRGKIVIRDKNDKETIIQSTPYALWDDTNRTIKPILAKHGFGLSFRVSQTTDRLITTAVLAHGGGHREETSFSAPIDNSGSKNNVQGWGSSMSYGKRYAATAILNITTRGEDDDGKKAGDPSPITDEQAGTLRELIDSVGGDLSQFLKYFKVQSLADLPASQFDRALAALKKRAGGK
jgi:hypothetical protein